MTTSANNSNDDISSLFTVVYNDDRTWEWYAIYDTSDSLALAICRPKKITTEKLSNMWTFIHTIQLITWSRILMRYD